MKAKGDTSFGNAQLQLATAFRGARITRTRAICWRPTNTVVDSIRKVKREDRITSFKAKYTSSPMEQMLRDLAGRQPDPAVTDRLGRLLLAAQVGSLLDHRIAQLAVGGRDTSAEASARKLIGVRYRQALEEFRMDLSPGAGLVLNPAVESFLNTRCLSIAGGTEQILLTMAGERLLGLPR